MGSCSEGIVVCVGRLDSGLTLRVVTKAVGAGMKLGVFRRWDVQFAREG